VTAPSFFPRRLEYVPLSQVPPAVRNPKKHDLPALVASFEEHGFADNLILDERTQRLVAGHGRTEALVWMKEQGLPMPAGLVPDDSGEWCVPMLRGWASKSDAHAEAFIILHNKLVEAGGWDSPMLAEMLHDVHAFDPDLFEGIGMTADDMDGLFKTVDPERFEADPDALPSSPGGGGEGAGGDGDDVVPTGRPALPERVECPMCFHQFDPVRNPVNAS
jgi:hypothetical protein